MDKFVPGPSHGDVAEAHMDDVVTGLSGIVISQGDKGTHLIS